MCVVLLFIVASDISKDKTVLIKESPPSISRICWFILFSELNIYSCTPNRRDLVLYRYETVPSRVWQACLLELIWCSKISFMKNSYNLILISLQLTFGHLKLKKTSSKNTETHTKHNKANNEPLPTLTHHSKKEVEI